jgi:spermidine synthase
MQMTAGGRWTLLLLGVYFLSGVTGVAYEVLWVRMLSVQFGVSNFGVVVTLVAFMSGLGAGGLLGAWFVRRFMHPLMLFALLEAAVAAFALSMPWLFGYVDGLLAAIAVDLPLTAWFLLQGVVSFLILFLPALALGVGFPLVLRYFENTPVTIVSVYGLNTLGGACGAVTPLLLLPLIGWAGAIQVVAVSGLLVALAAMLISLSARHEFAIAGAAADGVRPAWRTLLFYAGIGAAALMLQVGWTRLYGMILLRTEYVLAILLCVFLVGIGLGSLLARRIPVSAGLTWFPAAAGATALLSLAGLPLLATWADGAEFGSLAAALGAQGLAIAVLTLPTTLVLGAWLPLLSRSIGSGGNLTGAWLYGANATGAALGALAAGFVLVPWIGTAATICAAALLLFLFGMAWSASRRLWLALPLMFAIAWPIGTLPEVNRLLPGTAAGSRDLMVSEDALSITHVIEQPDGQRLLLSDLRRMEASTEPAAVAAQMNMARLPLILHPAPKDVLFLGLGTGITAAGSLALPELSVVAVELSAGAIAAARDWFGPVNHGITDKARIVHDDVRRYLRAAGRDYDVIVGDLFHPDLVGRSNLLSVQQFRRVRERLAGDGVFVQWLALNQFDARSLGIVMRSFAHVFPNASYYVDGFRVALVGTRTGRTDIGPVIERMAWMPAAQRDALTGGEGLWTWLGRFWGEIPRDDGPLQDEWAPRIEFSLPQARYAREFDLGRLTGRLLADRPDVDTAAALLGIPSDYFEAFESAYVATEIATLAWVASLGGRSSEAVRLMRMALDANPRDRWISFDIADRMYASLDHGAGPGIDRRAALERINAIRPDHVEVLHELWRLEAEAGNDDDAARYLQMLRNLAPLDRRIQ